MRTWLIAIVSVASFGILQAERPAPNVKVPAELSVSLFSDKSITPCVACIGVGADGAVFAGVDQIGSLGKGGGHGKIVKLIDADHDGVAEKHIIFAVIDNPRGIVPIGDKVYVLHTKWGQGKDFDGMYLSVLTDKDGDGKADGPPKHLIKEISTRKFNQARGVDHTTNGIRMGIDGWIYIAIGDFGFVDAVGTDGKKLTMYGGGVVRVRPDGTEIEEYVHGLRNIYDISIDPYMNMFTRGNTNDGGGWNIRFIHEIQSAEYGYPKMFKRFTEETLPALVDVGGGSGTGSMFFSEPGWPKKYTNVPMMCDWGRGHLYIHRVTPDGASFTQAQEDFIKCGRITDVDCDASGRLFLGSWSSSGFKGGTAGYVARVVPKGWKYKAAPNFKKASDGELGKLLLSASAKIRLNAQQALLDRGPSAARASAVKAVAASKSASLASRVAAIFTLKQLMGAKSHADLLTLAKDSKVTEFALRALGDRTTQVADVPLEPFYAGLTSKDPRVQVAAAVGLGRLGKKEAAKKLLAVSNPPKPHFLPGSPVAAPAAAPKVAEPSGKIFKSKIVQGRQTTTIDVDITGYKQLVLAIGDGGDGDGGDHGSWFEPTLVTKSGQKIKLTSLKWKKATQGWGRTNVNKDCRNKPLKRKDGKSVAFGIGSHASGSILYNKLPKGVVRFQATVGYSDGAGNGKVQFFVAPSTKGLPKGGKGKGGKGGKIPEGPHATPNPATILPHVAVKALINLNAVDACLAEIGSTYSGGALWALQYMHNAKAVDGLIGKLKTVSDPEAKQRVAKALVRLVNKERPYDGSHWWGTRPDTRGPYYYPTAWEQTDKIKAALVSAAGTSGALQNTIATLAEKDRAEISGLPTGPVVPTGPKPTGSTFDLEKIKNQKGQIGKMSVEDVIIAIGKVKGDPIKGPKLLLQQACVACHSVKKGQPLKGPFLGQIGSIMNRDKIAMSILRPNAEISQGFKTVQIKTKKGQIHIGFVTKRLSDSVEIRNIAGLVTTLKPADIAEEKLLPNSMMPVGLANGMSIEDFASLVTYLSLQKK